ncbi:protein phosphatase 2C domain-containing protein [Streptomyces sp. XM4193]|uniref:protein phosphatase 2C domain-containing protein n=1 Tax=Streptomyces sp. XM4193 TaxID=2929782 RepID=UPI001FFBC741|nr:protein phosphatase 2C domain-containing protein [Streptomyces sp. XM4193]MCK1797139.1 protein phosphatase 2C domain-containing protein [Streptomyces sp. XM4193]
MNRQGDGAGAPDWWSELYEGGQLDADSDAQTRGGNDAGESTAGDTIDERFRSAARTVGSGGVVGRPSPDTGAKRADEAAAGAPPTPDEGPAPGRADRPTDPRPADPRPGDSRGTGPGNAEPRGTTPRSADSLPADPGDAGPRDAGPRDAGPRNADERGAGSGAVPGNTGPLAAGSGDGGPEPRRFGSPREAVPPGAVPQPDSGGPRTAAGGRAAFGRAGDPAAQRGTEPRTPGRDGPREAPFVRRRSGLPSPRPAPVAGPAMLPAADPDRLHALTPDTVLDGAHHGPLTVRAVSTRGDLARHQGRPRGDALLTARFGSGDSALLVLVLATGASRHAEGHLAAREACEEITAAVGRSRHRLSEDLRSERRASLKSGLGRLTARTLGRLRASAVEQGYDPTQYTAALRCLVLPADPRCRIRLFFGVGAGGLFRLRAGQWQDLEPVHPPARPAMVIGDGPGSGGALPSSAASALARVPVDPQDLLAPRTPPFLFRTSVAEPGDALLLCSEGMAEPLRTQEAFGEELGTRWNAAAPPNLTEFLGDAQLPSKGHTEDRTVIGVWEPAVGR